MALTVREMRPCCPQKVAVCNPLDVRTLIGVFRTLIANGATVIVIEHDLDLIRSADYIIDMGPGGGEDGGRIVAVGTPEEIRASAESITGRYL